MDVQRFAVCGVIFCLTVSCAEKNSKTLPHVKTEVKSDSDAWLEEGYRYLEDPRFRRQALEDSLVNPENGYSRTRLKRYTEQKWGALPVWTPRVRKITPADIGAGYPRPDFSFEAIDANEPMDNDGWMRLGEQMFTLYPAQIEPAMRVALTDPRAPSIFGLWQTDDWVGGLVWVELPDGVQPALTCATCHASVSASGEVISGLPNYDFNLGSAIDAHQRKRTRNSDWGPGRIDITGDGIFNPTVIADIRPVRFQSHLQRAATIKNTLSALAIRLETNIISITGGAVRPPRESILALALYLWRLGDTLPPPPSHHAGQAVFDTQCASCHTPPGFGGSPIPIEDVGTPNAVGISPYRTTGMYQTPSLRGVSNRRQLTASGAFSSLKALLAESRTTPGHPYHRTLSQSERTLLLDFLNEL